MNRRHFVKQSAGAMALTLMAQAASGSQERERTSTRTTMKIKLCNVFVDEQDKALEFYTSILGFVKKRDFPVGAFKWLTVVSADEPDGTELLLEPNDNPAAKTFQKALFDQGIPQAAFAVENLELEYERLKELGVRFQTEPTSMGPSKIAVLDDTCGNLIQLYQVVARP